MAWLIGGLPQNLSEKLTEEYLEVKKRFSMSDWGPGQLKGGRFAEVVLRIFQQLLGDPVTPLGTDIASNEKTRILGLVEKHSTIDKHIRQKMVPLARLLLDFRNNRDAAHLGGFNANSMDTLFVMTSVTWILCELMRVHGGYSMQDAQKIVDSLAVKDYPVIMEFEGDLFITRPDLKAKEEVLVLLYKLVKADVDFLFPKTKDKNLSRFCDTLKEMSKLKLIAEKDGSYFLLPKGIETVEKEGLLKFSN